MLSGYHRVVHVGANLGQNNVSVRSRGSVSKTAIARRADSPAPNLRFAWVAVSAVVLLPLSEIELHKREVIQQL